MPFYFQFSPLIFKLQYFIKYIPPGYCVTIEQHHILGKKVKNISCSISNVKWFYLGTKSSSPGDPVKVCVGILGHVVVEHDVDTLYVHSSAKQIGRDQNTLLEVFELLVPKIQNYNLCTLKTARKTTNIKSCFLE